MAADTFERVMDAVIFPNEGGFVNDPRDPGGATNLGITRATLAASRGRPVSVAEVRALDKAEAREIYRAAYAKPIGFDCLPAGLDCALLDFAVNSGPARAIRSLQKVAGVDQDAQMGAKTLDALGRMAVVDAIRGVDADRLAFLTRLKTWNAFGHGWQRRVDHVTAVSIAMARGRTAAPNPLRLVDAVKASAAAKARPADTAIIATSHGQGIAATAAGAVATAIGQARDAIEPYVTLNHAVQMVFVGLTVLGLAGMLAGLAISTAAELRRLRSGAPV